MQRFCSFPSAQPRSEAKLQLRCPCHIYSECDIGCNCSLSWAQPISHLQRVSAAPSGPLRVQPQPLSPSSAPPQGTPFSSISLPNFTGNPSLFLFFKIILFFLLQKNSLGKLLINRTSIKSSVAVFLPPSCTQTLL